MSERENIIIGERKEEDTEALRQLFLKSRLSTFFGANTSQFSLSDFDNETKGEYILVAFADDMPVGFISVWVADNFIHHLYIDDEFQNRKIGSRLLHAVIDRFGLPVRLKCEESNTKAIRFYEHKGFIEKEKGTSKMGTYILFELS